MLPWTGNQWVAYTEYFQWSPVYNHNSDAFGVQPGNTMVGTVIYDEANNQYIQNQTCVETGQTSLAKIPIQRGDDGPWLLVSLRFLHRVCL